jgi:hypothetical protein
VTFTVSDVQSIAAGMIDTNIASTDAINWVNEAIESLDPKTWPEGRFGIYGAVASARYSLPSGFVSSEHISSVTNLLTSSQSTVEFGASDLHVTADSPSAVLSQSSEWAAHGIYSAKLESTLATAQNMAIDTSPVLAAISGGVYYVFGVRTVQNASGKMVRVGVAWCDKDAVVIATVFGDSVAASMEGRWLHIEAVSPSNAAFAYGILQIIDATQGDAIFWDGAMLYRVDECSSITSYEVRRQMLSFEDAGDYEVRYIAYPKPVMATSDTINLPDAFKWPLVKALASRQRSKDDSEDQDALRWKAEFAADINRIYSSLELNSDPFQVNVAW